MHFLKSPDIKKKTIKKFIYGFLPSKNVILVGIGFYIVGFFFAYLKPDQAMQIFNGGFYLGDIEAKISLPQNITPSYLRNQFINYLGAVSFNIFINNVLIAFLCIFTGIAIIPVILVGLFSFTGSITYLLIAKLGFFKAILILLGSFHLYFELLAGLLAIEAFLEFYESLIISSRTHTPNKFKKFKRDILNKFLPLILRIILLFAIASLLEVFWSTWWVYILTKQYVSWYDFYMGVYSCMVT
ncbi:MAG: stage II sporulation protein M [Euryarchaeota archaeon]|nr:stage II sporulation protein M [Euryarchaeota archaeon]